MITMLKLTTGEDIIADAQENNKTWTLKNVVRVVHHPQGIAMIPYDHFFEDDTLTVKDDHVVMAGEVSTEIRNAYNQKFGSGLVVPASGLKLVGDD